MGAGLFLYGRGCKRMPRWRTGRRIRGRGKGTDGRTPRSFAAGHSGNAVQDVVSVTLSKEKNSYGKFYQSGVMLVNASGETFTFDPKDIVVKVIDKYDNVKDMGVYSSDEYARKVTRNQDWTLFFSRVFDAMASDARYIAATDGEVLKALQSGSLKSETDGYLKKNTLHSGERLAGFVNIGYSKGCYMLMRIPVGGRDFVFRWKL